MTKSILALLAFVAIVMVFVLLKKRISVAMLCGFCGVLLFCGADIWPRFKDAVDYATTQNVTFAVMSFVFMAYVMEHTGIIGRLINIFNSIFGRVPGGAGIVSTLGSAAFGLVAGSVSGSAATVGSITIPWMEETGFPKGDATTIVSGNAGVAIIIPPSTNFMLYLGMAQVAAEIDQGKLYIACMTAGLWLLAIKFLALFHFVKKNHVGPVPESMRMPFKKAWKENWSSVTMFLGAIVPIIVTTGPLPTWLESRPNFGADGVDAINMLIWIPMMITVIIIIEGWKQLPHTLKGWANFVADAIKSYSDLPVLILSAYGASRLLNKLGLQQDMAAVFDKLSGFPSIITILIVFAIMAILAGPFNSTGVTTSIGTVSYLALRAVGVNPYVAVCALMIGSSLEGAIPPNSVPLFVAAGISGQENPGEDFKDLFIWYGLPTLALIVLMCLGVIPIYAPAAIAAM